MKFAIDKFEGPLDLLLSMIEEEKLDITEISLSNIAEQYISYLENHKDIDPDDMSNFLVIAAKLLLIKSKTLLPYLIRDEEEEEIQDFTKQLKIYKDFLEAAKELEKLAANKEMMHSRDMLRVEETSIFYPPPNVSAGILHANFIEIIDRIKPQEILAENTIAKSVSMEERIAVIKSHLKNLEQMKFSKLVADAKTKIDVIVNFMAVLELMKQRSVTATQSQLFADIEIIKL